MPHLSPTTLTADEQRLNLRATTGSLRDHLIISLALGRGLRLEPSGRTRSHSLAARHPAFEQQSVDSNSWILEDF